MEIVAAALIAGMAVNAIDAIFVIIIILHFRDKRKEWEQVAEDNYIRGKDEAGDLLRKTIDKVEEDKGVIAEMSDRELLERISLALAAQGRRIDRVEDKVKCITNYKTYIDDMNAQTQKMVQGYIVLDEHAACIREITKELQQCIGELSLSLQRAISGLGDLKETQKTVNANVIELQETRRNVAALQRKIKDVVDDMERVMATYNESPITMLKIVEIQTKGLLEMVAELGGETSEIRSATDDALYRIDNVLSRLNSLTSELSSVSSDSEKILEITEETLGRYGYNSIPSKLDEMSSDIDSIKYRLNA